MGPVATWAVTQHKPPDPPRDDPGHLQAANRVAKRHQSRISTAKYGFDTSLVYHGCVISRVICCPLSILTSRQIARDKMQIALTTVGPLIPCRSASFSPRSEPESPPKRIARRHGVEIGELSTFVRSQPATLHPAPLPHRELRERCMWDIVPMWQTHWLTPNLWRCNRPSCESASPYHDERNTQATGQILIPPRVPGEHPAHMDSGALAECHRRGHGPARGVEPAAVRPQSEHWG